MGLFGCLKLSGSFRISRNLSEFLGLPGFYGIFETFPNFCDILVCFSGLFCKIATTFVGLFLDLRGRLGCFENFYLILILQNFFGFLGFFGIYWDFPGCFLRIFQSFLEFLGKNECIYEYLKKLQFRFSRIQMHFVQQAYSFILSRGYIRTLHAQLVYIREKSDFIYEYLKK